MNISYYSTKIKPKTSPPNPFAVSAALRGEAPPEPVRQHGGRRLLRAVVARRRRGHGAQVPELVHQHLHEGQLRRKRLRLQAAQERSGTFRVLIKLQ